MEFNKIIRGAKRAIYDQKTVFDILDAGFICHVAFQVQGQTMMIPTAYGRKGEEIYLHGSVKNQMLNQLLNGQTACITVTHLDGIVLARTLFDTSANYRSAVLFGKAELVEGQEARLEGLKIITENIIKGRWSEVAIASETELAATMVIKFTIESASAKVRAEGPMGDENKEEKVWSGVIPLSLQAGEPEPDKKSASVHELTPSVKNFVTRYSGKLPCP